MKLLTALTILLSIPTMVASVYGMNVALPGQHQAGAFLAVVAASILLAAGTAALFWFKRWL